MRNLLIHVTKYKFTTMCQSGNEPSHSGIIFIDYMRNFYTIISQVKQKTNIFIIIVLKKYSNKVLSISFYHLIISVDMVRPSISPIFT